MVFGAKNGPRAWHCACCCSAAQNSLSHDPNNNHMKRLLEIATLVLAAAPLAAFLVCPGLLFPPPTPPAKPEAEDATVAMNDSTHSNDN